MTKAAGQKDTIRTWKETTDDWYPNFEGNIVAVSLLKLNDIPPNNCWRVSIWGADDDGMEKDFLTRIEALDEFNLLPEVITKDYLIDRGFSRA